MVTPSVPTACTTVPPGPAPLSPVLLLLAIRRSSGQPTVAFYPLRFGPVDSRLLALARLAQGRGASLLLREASLGLETLATPRWLVPKRLILLGLTIGYIVLVEWGGFTLTTFAFLWFAMVLLGDGRNKLFAAIISAAMALGGYLLFIVAFETRFPEGPFELLMKGLM